MSLYKIHTHKTKLVLCFILFQFYQKVLHDLSVTGCNLTRESEVTKLLLKYHKGNSFTVSSDLSSLSANVIAYSDSVRRPLFCLAVESEG